jgi:glc operon protein GlcG
LLTQVAAAQLPEKKVLTLEIARKIVETAESEAARNHLAGVVAVVDHGGWPILIERMDHAAYIASVDLAPTKARTAAVVAAVITQGVTEMQRGVPIVVGGEVIGAFGAGFDTPEHDAQIAQPGLRAVPH